MKFTPSRLMSTRLLAAVLLAGFAASGAPAQSPPPISSERPANLPSLGNSDMDRRGTNFIGGTSIMEPRLPKRAQGPFFLPVLLPVLGAPRSADPEPLSAGYPRESAGEPFLMAKGNLAANHLLSDQRADHLASYRTARLTLLTELLAELDRGQTVPAAERERALAELAAVQTPRLLELEAEAEKIRHELSHVDLLKVKDTADDIGKLVPAGENPDLKEELAAVRMILSAAHFRAGFSPDQRRLLEEMAQEIRLTIESDRGGRAVFFWPAGARIPPPLGLPPGAAAKFEEFQHRKTALKVDLRAALERERKQVFNVKHTETFEQLAAAQAPRFAELDALADEIRPALAALAAASDKVATELPYDLARQLAELAERKAALQRDLYAKLAEFRFQLPADHLALAGQGSDLAITVLTSSDLPSNRALVLARLTEFNEEISTRFAALATLRDRVRDTLARYQATNPGAKPGVTVDRLAAEFLTSHRAQEARNRQRDYAAAVLASCLSPAQRRLLLTAAAVDSLQESPSSVLPPIATSLR